MSIIKHVIISVAGMGTRLGLNQPKCLVKVNDKMIIDYLLELVADIENVRVVVGFMENEVIKYIKNIRNDIIFVRNPNYRNTTNAYSVYLATKDLSTPYLIIDGDLLINKYSYNEFIKKIEMNPLENLIGITKSKTEEAVFVKVNRNLEIIEFTRGNKEEFEWSGVAYLNDINIKKEGGFVFSELAKHLPLNAYEIICWEIDTPEDLEFARRNYI